MAKKKSKKKTGTGTTNQNTGPEWMAATAERLSDSRKANPSADQGQTQEGTGAAVMALERAVTRRQSTTAKASSPAVLGGSSGSREPVALDPVDSIRRLGQLVADTEPAVLRGAAQEVHRHGAEGLTVPSFNPTSHTWMVDGRPVQVPHIQ